MEQERSKSSMVSASNHSARIGIPDEQSHGNTTEAHTPRPSSRTEDFADNLSDTEDEHDHESTTQSHELAQDALQDERLGPSSNPLHPIVIHYQENEMSLFPPRHGDEQSETYFLHDEALAGSSICDVLKACRLVLADSIGEGEELIMNISSLNLEVSEVSQVEDDCS